MKTLGNIQPRRTIDELLAAQARARRDRHIAFCILVAAVLAVVGFAAWLSVR